MLRLWRGRVLELVFRNSGKNESQQHQEKNTLLVNYCLGRMRRLKKVRRMNVSCLNYSGSRMLAPSELRELALSLTLSW